MNTQNVVADAPTGYPSSDHIDLAAFAAICEQSTDRALVPRAASVERNVPIYDGDELRRLQGDPAEKAAVSIEWARLWDSGPGVLVIKRAYPDRSVVDDMSAIFHRIMDKERATRNLAADHFAKAGANTRVWNALEKSAYLEPKTFIRYYSNALVALAAEAWLGPWYQITAQVNVVHPGGAAQDAHRDYHLGFQSALDCARFPRHVHAMSQALVIQGAVAHCEMPVETGPTRFLPFSQRYVDGLVAWRDPRFIRYFEEHFVQLPLDVGDAVFFNPSLHHGAGHNSTKDRDRLANLLEISSVFGKPMEAVDRYAMSASVYPTLAQMARDGEAGDRDVELAIAAMADGYGFPSNLDAAQPAAGGLGPETAQLLLRRAVREQWPAEKVRASLASMRREKNSGAERTQP